jgi:hypothetical protein
VLARDVAQELQVLGRMAERAGDNLDAERADMTTGMASAPKNSLRAWGSPSANRSWSQIAAAAIASPARAGAHGTRGIDRRG